MVATTVYIIENGEVSYTVTYEGAATSVLSKEDVTAALFVSHEQVDPPEDFELDPKLEPEEPESGASYAPAAATPAAGKRHWRPRPRQQPSTYG